MNEKTGSVGPKPKISELSDADLQKVSGGFVPAIGVALGAVAGAANGYRSNGFSGAVHGAIFGAAVGVTGGLAAATSGFVRLAWAARSVGLTVAGGATERGRIVINQN